MQNLLSLKIVDIYYKLMDQQLIYKIQFAGFYEGEGSISNDKSNNERIRLSITQNDITPLLLAKQIWGGSVVERNRISLTNKICNGNYHKILLKIY